MSIILKICVGFLVGFLIMFLLVHIVSGIREGKSIGEIISSFLKDLKDIVTTPTPHQEFNNKVRMLIKHMPIENEQIKQYTSFIFDDGRLGIGSKSYIKGIALNKETGEISIYSMHDDNVHVVKKSISVTKLISAEIIEDGNSIYKTNRASQIGGALIGSVIFGGVGAVIGGLSGSKSKLEECKKLGVQLIFNDLYNPTEEFDFIHVFPVKKSNKMYMECLKEANDLAIFLNIMMKQNYPDFETKVVVCNGEAISNICEKK